MRRFAPSLAILLLTLATAASALDAERIHLRGGAVAPDALRLPDRADSEALLVVHFDRSPGRAEREAVAAAGAEILNYLPVNAYLLRAPAGSQSGLAAIDGVDGLGLLRPEWKLAPELAQAGRAAGPSTVALHVARGTDVEAAAAFASAAGAVVLKTSAPGSRLWVEADGDALAAVAAAPTLVWVEPVRPIAERNNDVKWAVQAGVPDQTPIWDHGIHGEGQIVGHLDSNLFIDNCWFEDHEGDPVGPDHRKVVFMGSYPGFGTSGHGTHTAGTVCGDSLPTPQDAPVSRRGIAYEARLAHSNYVPTGEYDLYADFVLHHDAGARVHTNSWGQDGIRNYTSYCVDIDRFSWEYEEDMIAFACTNQSILYTPENAKNVLAVGGTGSGWNYAIYYSAGEGPTEDGRRKPEIFSPGLGIDSASKYSYCAVLNKSGTSMAAPGVSGGIALARQYFTEGWYPTGTKVPGDAFTPSGALLKAVALNATLTMADPNVPGDYAEPRYPNTQTGWGRLALDESLLFADERGQLSLQVEDLRHAQGLETGQTDDYAFTMAPGVTAVKITLAFMDYPGALNALQPVVNDLDLIVVGPGGTYLGNVFDLEAFVSQTGGAADPINNVERVILEDAPPGGYTVTVQGEDVPLGPQGYALVITTFTERTPVALSFFSASPGAGAVDVAWETGPDAEPAEYRLEAGRDGALRAVAHAEVAPGRFEARDEDAALLDGGAFTYTLSARLAGEDWLPLRSETVDLPPAAAATRLHGAHPNPFNPRTTVRFSLGSRQALRLEVFDLSGRRVAVLADGVMDAGEHAVDWNGRDGRGRAAASGVYLVRLAAAGVTETGKLVLLR